MGISEGHVRDRRTKDERDRKKIGDSVGASRVVQDKGRGLRTEGWPSILWSR